MDGEEKNKLGRFLKRARPHAGVPRPRNTQTVRAGAGDINPRTAVFLDSAAVFDEDYADRQCWKQI